MKSKIAKKIIAISSIFTFICSFTNPVFAELIQENEDGVAYDLFNNENSIILENCTIDNGTVTLVNKSYLLEYDHATKPNNVEAWEHDDPFFVPGGDFAKILSTITNPSLLGKYEFFGYTNINSRDNNAYETESIAVVSINYVYHPLHLFKIKIDEKIEQLKESKFEVGWWTGPYNNNANLEEIRMYLWSYGDLLPRWNFIDKINYSKEEINAPNGFIYSEEAISKYASNEGIIHILIVGKPIENIDPIAPAILSTDYVKVEIPIVDGYKTNGHIISDEIKPASENFKGWEKITWEGSVPTDETYIKIKVLDSNANELTESVLDGNSDGFINSPIDISSLETSVTSIRLKAIFHTDLFAVTPRLFKWGVLWHTTEGYFDSFTSDFKLGESQGVKIEDKNVKISEFYSEWSIFGKNSANTRSYIGPGGNYKINQTYWRTDINENIGGWFKTPIMSDGKIFIPANNSKIYAFDLLYNKTYGTQKEYRPSDISTGNYEIETSMAAYSGYLIVATSKLDSNQNRIYALNSSDLSETIWTYPPDDDNGFTKTICFSAAPTISKGKVYVTSWSGQHADSPILNYINSKIDEFFKYRIGINNKLFILDLASGYEIINPIRLPAASLSTPAIDDGMIYVGCENYQGPSLFAIDEITGKFVWNASVGIIGRSSPIVVNSKNGKMVIVVARDQSILSNKGTDRVIGLNAENGKILWNFSIGNESVLFRRSWLNTYEFNHIKATEPPAATPAFYDNIVYVMASDGIVYAIDVNTGKELWRFSTYQSIVTEYHSCSPIVVDGLLYVIAQDAKLFALNPNTGEIVVEHPIEYENFVLTSYAYASPIIVDGLAIISFLDWRWRDENIYFGHLITLGEFGRNLKGRLYSDTIHIEKGNWWDKFSADYFNTTENAITFSILDRERNTLISGLSGLDNNLSTLTNIKTNEIILCAELSILNLTGTSPILKSWGVTWKPETTAPQFSSSSFKPDPNGWIRNNTPICSIEIQDAFPGLNIDEAYYRLTYRSGQKSNWIKAESNGPMGSRSVVTLTADLTKLSYESGNLKRIEFKIEDLAGNSANFELGNDFKIDQEKPISSIENKINLVYNTPVDIDILAEDPADPWGNISGIKSLAIYYRTVGEDNWVLFDTAKNLVNWKFSPSFSSEFEICTIATDNAGNVEDFPVAAEASFIYDSIKPEIPELGEYVFNWIPVFNIIFEDDYKLHTVEYRIDFSANWTKINTEDINAKNYSASWSLAREWDKLKDNETYNLFFRLTDIVGNQNETQSFETLKFSIDTIPPGTKVTLDLSDFDEKGKDSYRIFATIPDNEQIANVTLHYSYSSNDGDYNAFKQYGEGFTTSPYEWIFKPEDGSGYYRFIIKVWDAAGNYNNSPIKKVNVTKLPYLLLILLILVFVILVVISIIIIKKIKAIKG